jgi:hypothetical protein
MIGSGEMLLLLGVCLALYLVPSLMAGIIILLERWWRSFRRQ